MEFLTSMARALDLLVVIELLSLLLFVAFYKKLRNKDRWIVGVIVIYAVGDLIGAVMASNTIPNQWVYSMMLIPQLLLVTYTLVNGMKNRKSKQIMMGGSFTLALAHIINMSWFEGYDSFCALTYIPAVTWMAVCSFMYLREQINNYDSIPFDSLLSWFALATLIDHTATMPILTSLSWPAFANSKYGYDLWDIANLFYMSWFFINVTGLLWTQTSLKSRFLSR
ncbi:MAG TPA: hypothetical protein PKD91_05235 [Bacteroidia bacterium]|nr:hypothetical protein [Bacteroidia bacterium]